MAELVVDTATTSEAVQELLKKALEGRKAPMLNGGLEKSLQALGG